MTRYIANEDGTYGPSRRSGHDDCVVSYGIALMTIVTESANLEWAAMAAPGPAYIPGQTPPRLINAAREVNPTVMAGAFGTGGFDSMTWDDPTIMETY